MDYDALGVDIKDVQKIQFEILKEFDRICKENGIKYQLFAGTLLGAVRHKGFVPWDDDIDVCLLRCDYEKFLEVCAANLDSAYFLQTYESDRNYIGQFAKIRKKNTVFVEKATAECDIHQGIFIDVFPLDNVLPCTFAGWLQQKSIYVLGRINLSRIKRHCLYAKKPINKCLSLVFHYLLKIIPKRWTDQLQTKIICLFEECNATYVSHLTNGASVDRYNRYMVKKGGFYDCIEREFEGHKFPIPCNYDEVLNRIFGDYMELPPLENRKPHHGIIEVRLDIDSRK